MNVSPMAATSPAMPFGRNSAKLASQSGLVDVTQMPKPIIAAIVPSWIIVTMVPVRPVSDVPLTLMYVNTATASMAISLSNGMKPRSGSSDRMPAMSGPSRL